MCVCVCFVCGFVFISFVVCSIVKAVVSHCCQGRNSSDVFEDMCLPILSEGGNINE